MKIISQSTVLQKAPYFHLAYIAATSRTPARSYLGGGLFIIFMGCILSLKLTERKGGKEKRKTKSKIILRKDNPTWLAMGLLFVIAGIALILLSYKYGERTYDHPEMMTKSRISRLYNFIEMHLELGEQIPENLNSMSKQWQLSKSDIRDAWSNLMQLRTETENGTTQYTITSAGKDSTFGTEDDIVGADSFKRVGAQAASQQTVNNAGIQY
ncbi:MAG: hypothetical protein A2Z38_03190 [Planctomycetes bacterium RBG_19FT_COMBO_48_8]|nr:MAG: hypothetical protein A2Z38_03190 [Planctomycetes bacterium RBG_19FT_COMBO_48_8]